jgi:hypothetical protein
LTLNWRESADVSYVYGMKLSSDGSLLFQPSTSGIDVFDARFGTLRSRISLPVQLSRNFDALVSDGRDNVLIAITGTTGSGIAVVDLSGVPEPPPLTFSSSKIVSRTNAVSATPPQVKRSVAQGASAPATTSRVQTLGRRPKHVDNTSAVASAQ